jgi:UDP-3-O-[3-hydroxymyristoyl] glucosamine N-acyltransferase
MNMNEKSAGISLTLAELAARFGLELRGEAGHRVHAVGTLAGAGPGDIGFLANRGYRRQLEHTRAGAVILRAADAERCPVSCLIADDPYLSYARVASLFDKRPAASAGIHPAAVVDPQARLGTGVHVAATAVIGPGAKVGDGCSIGPGCSIAAGAVLGDNCRLAANVTLMDGVRLGNRVLIHAGAVIGSDGFGIARADDHWEKVPQLGGVSIGDDCEIGANSAIDRGAIEDTVLEEDVRVDNLVQVGHNVRIGAHTAIAGASAIAGSTTIGRDCLLGGGCGVAGHIAIADRVTIAARSCVMKTIVEPGSVWGSAVPARPLRDWQHKLAQLNRLERLAERVHRLESAERKEPDYE